MGTLRTEVTDLIRLAEKQGWDVKLTGGGHYKWTPPNGQHIITCSTPDSKISWDNDKARLKRAGLVMNRAEWRRQERARRNQTEHHGPSGAHVADIEVRLRERVQVQRAADEIVVGPVTIDDSGATIAAEHKEPTVPAGSRAFWDSTRWCPHCGQEAMIKNMGRHLLRHGLQARDDESIKEFVLRSTREYAVDLRHDITPKPMRRSGPRVQKVVEAPEPAPVASAPVPTEDKVTPPPARSVSENVIDLKVRAMLDAIWPTGFPTDADAYMHLAEWIEPTKEFLRNVL